MPLNSVEAFFFPPVEIEGWDFPRQNLLNSHFTEKASLTPLFPLENSNFPSSPLSQANSPCEASKTGKLNIQSFLENLFLSTLSLNFTILIRRL
ncbi:MAG: hypothetical protein DRO52_01845 [Candidatus Hecatellales archaeon]|nr:MAG: hypothetical protein DRO52_01845 [Candidatus Hecatellales archaeon]